MRAEMLRFLTARLGNPAVAEDVYQDLFLRIQTAQVPQDLRDPRSFLYRSAYNLANEAMRARRRQALREAHWTDYTTSQVGKETVAQERAADEALDAKQRLETLAAIIAELPPRCREVFILCRVQGRPHREVADCLGISTKAVEKHITAALRHLTDRLGRRYAS
jgi:RNA polymerase sigma factor (sigma-70 family)